MWEQKVKRSTKLEGTGSVALWCEPVLGMRACYSRTWICILATLLLSQLPANAPGKAAEDGQSTWVPATHGADGMEFLVYDLCLSQP